MPTPPRRHRPLRHGTPASALVGTDGLRVLLASGAEAAAVYTVPEDGDLELVCHLPGHLAQGMVGRIELRGATGG